MQRRDFISLLAAAGVTASSNMAMAQTNQPAGKPIIITPNDAHLYSMGQGEAHILVDGDRSAGAWWMGEFREQPGFMTPLHYHPRQDEQFYVLEGVLSVYAEDKWYDLEPGSVAIVPHGVRHAQGNTGNVRARFLGSGNPAGFEQSFAEIDQLARRLQRSDPKFQEELEKILAKFDTKTLGPAPPRN
jgi:mannose-6-phosphate isomerase-like protein (cupin superfamily)